MKLLEIISEIALAVAGPPTFYMITHMIQLPHAYHVREIVLLMILIIGCIYVRVYAKFEPKLVCTVVLRYNNYYFCHRKL